MKKKSVAKIVVNSLTLSRIAGTICLPFVFTMCSAPVFLLFISSILFTDFLDGFLARKFDVSTIFGSIADMTADKIFGIALLVTLTTIYPLMSIPLVLEVLIAGVNINSLKNGGMGKSSQIGRIKMWIVGLSICSLLLVGLSPELNKELSNINISEINSIFENIFRNMGNNIDKIINQSKSFIINNKINFNEKVFEENLTKYGADIDNFVQNIKVTFQQSGLKSIEVIDNNKNSIKSTAELSTILSELYVLRDYLLKNVSNKNVNKSYKEIIKELKLNKEFIKNIALDEEYYKKTKDKPLIKKLTNNVDK